MQLNKVIEKINKGLPDSIPPLPITYSAANMWLLTGNENKKQIDKIRRQYIEHIKELRLKYSK